MEIKTAIVALVRESVSAPTHPRREAASILVDILHCREGIPAIPAKLKAMETDGDTAVAAAMRILVDEYGLGNSN